MSQAIVFTAVPVSPNRNSSPLFKELGANGLAPAEAASSKISLIATGWVAYYRSFAMMWAVILSLATKAVFALDTLVSGQIPLAGSEVPNLFPEPLMIISVESCQEAQTARLITAGYQVKAQGAKKSKVFTGPGTLESIQVALKEGAKTNASAPSNMASIDGMLALNIINRILFHAFIVTSNPVRYNPSDIDATTPVISESWRFTENNLEELPERGFFFPYFDGLCLPDRSWPIVWITQTFSRLLGPAPKIIAQNVTTLSRGWASLNDTSAGRMISHATFILSLAVSANCALRPVYLHGEYVGCVVTSTSVAVMTTFGVFPPGKKEELKEGILKFMSHDAAVSEIATLLSTLLTKDDKKSIITSADLPTVRAIHDQIRSRQYEPRHQQALVASIRKTRFRQTLWNASNAKHVLQAVMHIVKGEFPPMDTPINPRGDGIFTTDPIYSVLSAFDVKVPSLIGTGNALARGIAKDMYSGISKPGPTSHLPIFFKPLQEAHRDWELVKQSCSVWFVANGVDKETKKLRVKGVGLNIPLEADEAKSIVGMLCTWKAKRPREEEHGEPTDSQKEASREAKRKRDAAYQNLLNPTNMVVDDDFFA